MISREQLTFGVWKRFWIWSRWVVDLVKKKGNIVREDWIDQREKEAGLVTRMSWYIKELVLRFEVRRLIRFVSGG